MMPSALLLRALGPVLLAGLCCVAGDARAQSGDPRQSTPALQQPAPEQPVIDRNGVLILIRSALLALDHANRTGNYTVLRDLGAPSFQAANTAARLGEIFASLRAQNLDLSGLAVLEPQLTVMPTMVQGELMRMAGFFPSVPLQVNFDLLFAPVEGRWRLFGISINLGPSAPVAPAAAPASQPPAPAAEKAPEPRSQPKPETRPGARQGNSGREQPRRSPPQRPAAGDARPGAEAVE